MDRASGEHRFQIAPILGIHIRFPLKMKKDEGDELSPRMSNNQNKLMNEPMCDIKSAQMLLDESGCHDAHRYTETSIHIGRLERGWEFQQCR